MDLLNSGPTPLALRFLFIRPFTDTTEGEAESSKNPLLYWLYTDYATDEINLDWMPQEKDFVVVISDDLKWGEQRGS